MNKIASRKNKVIIIGAGAAGLGAAEYLCQNGIQDVIILEANNRFGGRIHTVQFGHSAGHIVELGANWIHGGTCANPMHTLQIQNRFVDRDGKIPYLKRFKHCLFATSDGRLIENEIGIRAIDLFFRIERAAYMIYFQKTPSITPEMNLLDYMRRELDARREKEFSPEEQEEAERALNSLMNYLTFHTSDDLEKLSLKQYGTFQEIPGGDAIVPGGFLNLMKKITDVLPSDCIKLNKRVIKINWQSDSFSKGGSKVTLECDDGTIWEAEHAIITVSLGYLKRHHETLFHPELPHHKTDAIAKIGFGCTDKIFLEFERPFWVQGKLEVLAIGWSSQELQERSNESDWEKSIFGFEEVYDNPNVLLCWLAGRGAEFMETVPDSDVIDTCTRLLRSFTGNPNIPKPLRILRTKWRQDPLILGAYSYATPASGLLEIANLARPEPSASEPVLMFAGEATHPNYYSTVHGALLSGIREARRIVALNSSQAYSKL